MAVTPCLQRQNTEILNICDNLVKDLERLEYEDNKQESKRKIVTLINMLLGKLLVNLSMKDKVLYPEAVEATNNKSLSAKALELMYEMGRLKSNIMDYRENILMQDTKVETFVQETLNIINTLKKKIAKEENELYPLFSEYKESSKTKQSRKAALI
ncbi:MAG: hypothetical protein QNJ31_00400 [Candidatus Caenarcaniphilales bacterium]|nr:hypothetical protein [Candidatus Caenarcaniphilales bacterium]